MFQHSNGPRTDNLARLNIKKKTVIMESTSAKRQSSASIKRRNETIQVVNNCDGRINIYFPHRKKRKKTSNNDDQSGKSSISLSSCVSLSGLSRVPDSQEVQVGSGGGG